MNMDMVQTTGYVHIRVRFSVKFIVMFIFTSGSPFSMLI
jgi:hypothetical protein